MADTVDDRTQDGGGKFDRLLHDIARWIMTRGGTPEAQESSREVADDLNSATPDLLSARKAVQLRRKNMKDMDEQTRDD